MKFWKRLLYYGIGVGLGVLMVQFIFGDRDIQCSYFPNDRVLYDIRNKERVFNDSLLAQMRELEIDTSDISDMLLMGDVDFKKSETEKDSCKLYWIDFTPENKTSFSAVFRNCDSLVTIAKIAR